MTGGATDAAKPKRHRFLAAPGDLAAVRALRAGDRRRLEALRAALAGDLAGRRCLVLGSAPDAKIPPRGDVERCICVNGSPFVAARHGLAVDLAVIVGFTTAMQKDVSRLSMAKLHGLAARRVVFVSAGDAPETARQALAAAGFGFEDFLEITPLERAAIVGEVCAEELGLGPRDARVSNGMFAALLALWVGAARVTLSGLSLRGGHDYAPDHAPDTPRNHVEGDTRCLRDLALRHGDRVDTTSAELQAAAGLAPHAAAPAG